MKRMIASMALWAACSSATFAEPLRLGVSPEPYMPMTSFDASGTWVGIEAELTNLLCADIADGCEIRQMSWDALIPALQENKFDFIVGAFSVTDKRREVVDFSSPYVYAKTDVIGIKSDSRVLSLTKDAKSDSEVLAKDGLEGAIFGVQAATIQANYLAAFLPDSKAQTYNTADNAISDMIAGRIDYLLIDSNFAKDFLTSADGADYEVKMRLPNNVVLGEGVAYAVRKGDAETLGKINTALDKRLEAGTVQEIMTKWGRE